MSHVGVGWNTVATSPPLPPSLGGWQSQHLLTPWQEQMNAEYHSEIESILGQSRRKQDQELLAVDLGISTLHAQHKERRYIDDKIRREVHLRSVSEAALRAVNEARWQDQVAAEEASSRRTLELKKEVEWRQKLEEQVAKLHTQLAQMQSKHDTEHKRAMEAEEEVKILVKRLSESQSEVTE